MAESDTVMPNPVDDRVITALQALARPPDAVFATGHADAWFDGFWDFFVRERVALTSAASWWLSGTWWFALYWHRPVDGRPGEIERRLDVFVERKDHPVAIAPWPVTSMDTATGREIKRDSAPRRGDPASMAALHRLGCTVMISHWGPHVTCLGEPLATIDVRAMIEATLGLLP